jgi:hypothetical protein
MAALSLKGQTGSAPLSALLDCLSGVANCLSDLALEVDELEDEVGRLGRGR